MIKQLEALKSFNFSNFMKFFQTQILTVYRIFSLVVLSSIVIGVLAYVSLLVFYGLNWSWATPMILSPTQELVLGFQQSITAIETQLSQQEVTFATLQLTLDPKKEQLESEQRLLERFQATKGSSKASNLKLRSSADALLRQINQDEKAGFLTKYDANRERASALNSIQQEEQLQASVALLETDIKAGELSINALKDSLREGHQNLEVAKDSPKYKALKGPVTVAFVPYENLSNAKIDAPVYDCYLTFLICFRVGKVQKVYEAEEYGVHPLFKTNLKGRLVDIKYTEAKASRANVVFIGSKPFFL